MHSCRFFPMVWGRGFVGRFVCVRVCFGMLLGKNTDPICQQWHAMKVQKMSTRQKSTCFFWPALLGLFASETFLLPNWVYLEELTQHLEDQVRGASPPGFAQFPNNGPLNLKSPIPRKNEVLLLRPRRGSTAGGRRWMPVNLKNVL